MIVRKQFLVSFISLELSIYCGESLEILDLMYLPKLSIMAPGLWILHPRRELLIIMSGAAIENYLSVRHWLHSAI